MDFIRINRRKIRNKLLFAAFCWGIVCLVYFASLRSKGWERSDISEEMYWMVGATSGYALFVFSLFFVANLSAFSLKRRLLQDVLSRKIFDNNSYSNELVFRKIWLKYTQEAVFGYIAGVPAVLRIDVHVASHTHVHIELHAFIERRKRTEYKTYTILLENKRVPEDVREKIYDFVSQIKSRKYKIGSVPNGTVAANIINLSN